jgi:hypothetical protein
MQEALAMQRTFIACLLVVSFSTLPSRALAHENWLNGEDRKPRLLLDEIFVDFFRRLTPSDAEQQRLGQLIQQLDSLVYKEREKASAALRAEGTRALPFLRSGLKSSTLEMRIRLEQVIKAVDWPQWAETIVAATQLLKRRQPDGALEALLGFVPFAPEDTVDPVLDALSQVGVHNGKVDKTLSAALRDQAPARRAAAAVLAGAFGNAEQRGVVRLLLSDPAPVVRLRAAEGLLAARDSVGVPVLISLLPRSDLDLAERAEAALLLLAGKTAPSLTLGDNTAARAKCQNAWLAWWNQYKDHIDLARAPLDWQELIAVRAPRLEGTTWFGEEFGEGVPCTFRFEREGKLVVSYNGLTVTDCNWSQKGRELYFEINRRFRETRGTIRSNTIECEAWNVRGKRWLLNLKKVK